MDKLLEEIKRQFKGKENTPAVKKLISSIESGDTEREFEALAKTMSKIDYSKLTVKGGNNYYEEHYDQDHQQHQEHRQEDY
nr:MAG TPA: hypothetical protein [Caudoviricetes sp.]